MVLCFVSSRRRHTRCALVTGVQTCALPIYSDYSQVKYELPPGSTLEQSETIARQIGAILDNSPVVDTAFYDINVGGGNAFLALKKHRDVSSVEWERSLQPKLAAIPDAHVSVQSQSGGFSGPGITLVIGGDDQAALQTHAPKIDAPN